MYTFHKAENDISKYCTVYQPQTGGLLAIFVSDTRGGGYKREERGQGVQGREKGTGSTMGAGRIGSAIKEQWKKRERGLTLFEPGVVKLPPPL